MLMATGITAPALEDMMTDETYDVHEALLMAWAEHDDLIARAEAAERRVAELEAQLAAQAWRPVVADRFNIPHDRPEFGENVELLITGFLNRAGQWVYNDDLPGFRTPVIGWRPID